MNEFRCLRKEGKKCPTDGKKRFQNIGKYIHTNKKYERQREAKAVKPRTISCLKKKKKAPKVHSLSSICKCHS